MRRQKTVALGEANATCADGLIVSEHGPVRVVTPPRVDWLSLAGFATGAECGMIETLTERGQKVLWRPGWWGKELQHNGRTMLAVRADRAVAGTFQWPQLWAMGRLRPTRVDICCDIEGFTFLQEHRSLFTMRKSKSRNHYSGETLETINIGGESSHVNMRLRVYNKTEKCTDEDRIAWAKNGWSGQDVWRVEYQINERALPNPLALPEDVPALFVDALARYRMCAVNPRSCCEQNKAPTHSVWKALQSAAGCAGKLTRRRRQTPVERRGDRVYMEALERLMKSAGVLLLPRLLRRVEHAIIASGGNVNGEDRKQNR